MLSRRWWDGRDRAAVQLADPARDGQADTRAAAGVVARAEAVEDVLRMLGGDALSLVGDLEPPPVGPVRAGADR